MKNRLIFSAIALALLQIGFLSWIIVSRAAILRNGQEVLLKVEPVDPRDLLRGDYVRLGYDISSVPASLIVNRPEDGSPRLSGPVWVRLEKGADSFWHPVSASVGKPFEAPTPQRQVDVRGNILYDLSDANEALIRVDYGIDRYYVPEGEGLAIEQDMRVRSFGILASAGRDGTLQIKALKDGDKTLFSEPLY